MYEALKPFMNRIDQQIDRKTDYFIKLGTRSPKDILGGPHPCSSGKEALEQLTESKRVYHDLFWFVDQKSELKNSMYLHFIAWKEFEKQNEIRCFVYQSKLVAITQYDLEKPTVLSSREAACVHVVDKLVHFIADKIPYKDYVMDVEINPGISIYVIEFNPWGLYGTTSPVLFDWEKDASILYCENPTTVCVRTQRHGYKTRMEQVNIPKLSAMELAQYQLVERSTNEGNKTNSTKMDNTQYNDEDWMQIMS